MTLFVLAAVWTAFWAAAAYLICRRMRLHVKVYLLAACSALFLSGAFALFYCLQ